MTTYHPEIYTVLAGLGWSKDCDEYPTRYGELENQNDSAFVFRPIKTRGEREAAGRTRFKLGVAHADATGLDAIPFREFDTTAPNWKRSIYTWHAAATFKLAEVRAKHAERYAEIERHNKKRLASWETLCAGSAAMRELAFPANHDDNGNVYDIQVNWSHKYWSSKALNGMTVAEQADKVRRLCEFLVTEGWNK